MHFFPLFGTTFPSEFCRAGEVNKPLLILRYVSRWNCRGHFGEVGKRSSGGGGGPVGAEMGQGGHGGVL